MRRRTFLRHAAAAITASALASCAGAPFAAQRMPRVGTMGMVPPGIDPTNPGTLHLSFVAGLSELGYQDGENIQVHPVYRLAGDADERSAQNAADVVALGVDVIVAYGSLNQRGAKAATSTIPIVVFSGLDPVAMGLVESLARPGGNVTGIASNEAVMAAKRLEQLKESFPTISRVVIFSEYDPGLDVQRRAVEDAAHLLGIDFVTVRARTDAEVPPALEAAASRGADALIFLGTLPGRREVRAFAATHRIPAIGSVETFVEMGGLMSLVEDRAGIARRAASYVVRILKGERPAEMPMEQPTKFELWINLKTAKEQGLAIPQSVLSRATRVIE